MESITELLKLNKPVVWTLHDENAFSGGCHYSAGCRNYETGCADCPQLKVNVFQLPFHVVNHKQRSWGNNITIVTPSKWLAECASKSLVFRESRVEVIPNSVETDIFRPLDKQEAKQSLGVPIDSLCLLFGAEYHSEKRKGYGKLKEALEICLRDDGFKKRAAEKKILILKFGDTQKQTEEFKLPVQSFGYVHSDEKLAKIYSAADLYVLPSLEDNLPNTMLESMACGTPVVSFPVGGMPDMIVDGVTGFVARDMSSESLATVILRLTSDPNVGKKMNGECRKLIESGYTLSHQANNYSKLFAELCDSQNTCKGSDQFSEIRSHKKCITLRNPKTRINRHFFHTYRQCALTIVKHPDFINNQDGKKATHGSPFIKRLKAIAKTHALLFYSHRAGRITAGLIKFSKNNLRKIWRKYKSLNSSQKRKHTK